MFFFLASQSVCLGFALGGEECAVGKKRHQGLLFKVRLFVPGFHLCQSMGELLRRNNLCSRESFVHFFKVLFKHGPQRIVRAKPPEEGLGGTLSTTAKPA